MLWLLGFFVTFVIGGLTGVMIAMVPFNWQAHDTRFIVAHLHYVLVGDYVFPMIAAIYYWLPVFRPKAVFPAGRGRVLADRAGIPRHLPGAALGRPAGPAAAHPHL